MKLEDEIQQLKFNSEHQKLAVNLIFTYNWLHAQQNDYFRSFGITLQQFNVLRILRGMKGQPASVKLVRERMLDKSSDASRIIEKLRQKEYVMRTIRSDDRRACDVIITPKGTELLARIDIENRFINQLFQKLQVEDMQMLNRLLDDVRG